MTTPTPTNDQIGTMYSKPWGYKVVCVEPGCGWYRDFTGELEEAKKSMRSHASICHPVPIKVYREEAL